MICVNLLTSPRLHTPCHPLPPPLPFPFPYPLPLPFCRPLSLCPLLLPLVDGGGAGASESI